VKTSSDVFAIQHGLNRRYVTVFLSVGRSARQELLIAGLWIAGGRLIDLR
jgi:hypothetical protein